MKFNFPMNPHVRMLVGRSVDRSVGWLVGGLVGRSVIISQKGGKLIFHAPTGALILMIRPVGISFQPSSVGRLESLSD